MKFVYQLVKIALGTTFCLAGLLLIGVFAISWLRAQSQSRIEAEYPMTIIQVGELERQYLLHVPEDLPPNEPLPLVFVFHGGSGLAGGAVKLTRFSEIANREKFLVVYPQGVGKSWNDGRVSQVSQAHRENVDDLAFFDALLAELGRQFPIDQRRVYLTGISNGGILSHFLAAQRAEKIAAIAPVVGGIAEPFDQKFKPAEPVSVLMIQGTEDTFVPYHGGKVAPADGKDRGSVISTDKAVQLWVKANGCKTEPEKELHPNHDPQDGCRTEVSKWKDGQANSEVWLYRVEGGGHTWPSGPQYLPQLVIGRVTHDFGSQAIWDFFKSHPKAK